MIAEYVNGAAPTAPTREYIYAGSRLMATHEGSNLTYHHADHLSTRVETDSTGNVTRQFGHYPFGEVWYESGTLDKWKFTSYERDGESGLDYAIFRYDSSRLGRFMTPDPLAGTIFNPQSLNRYAYVLNDPVNKIDPLGLACFWACVTAGGETSCEWYCDADPFSDASQSGRGGRAPIQDQPQPAEERGPIRTPVQQKIADLVNQALQHERLAKCLNKWIGPGIVLTNENRPYVDASENLPGATFGQTRTREVPPTGRGTAYIDKGVFSGLSATDPFLVMIYLHEVANVLATQQFTHEPDQTKRALLGPRGGPPTEEQRNSYDKDIGEQFAECLAGKD